MSLHHSAPSGHEPSANRDEYVSEPYGIIFISFVNRVRAGRSHISYLARRAGRLDSRHSRASRVGVPCTDRTPYRKSKIVPPVQQYADPVQEDLCPFRTGYPLSRVSSISDGRTVHPLFRGSTATRSFGEPGRFHRRRDCPRPFSHAPCRLLPSTRALSLQCASAPLSSTSACSVRRSERVRHQRLDAARLLHRRSERV